MNSAGQTADPAIRGRKSLFWPEKALGPRPGLKEMNVVCWALFVSFLLAPLCVVHWVPAKHGAGSIRQLNSDFVYFYGVGRIAHQYSPGRIYDYGLQHQIFNSIQPPRGGVYSPSPYPPYVAMFFTLFAGVSFETAYLLWMAISLTLYLIGIGATAGAVFPREPLKISLTFCFALAFFPFVFPTLINGQLSTIAVFAIGVGIYQERHGSLFRSGLALALLSYKPTLLLLVVPMLLITRRFRALGGFLAGAGVLIIAATFFAGIGIWPVYARMLQHFAQVTGVEGASRLQLWKYLDLHSFFALIPGGRSGVAVAILDCAVVAAAIALAVLLWKSSRAGRPAQWLAWAATLTWTLLLNVYAPIYDSVLVVIAIILTLGALKELRGSTAAEWTTLLAILIFAVSWKTETFAKAHGIQLLTIMLVVLGIVQLRFLQQAIRENSRPGLRAPVELPSTQ